MSKKLTVLLGAGFSANVGMPLSNKIADYFNRDLKDKLLCFPSSEWAWIDNKSDANINNGSLSVEKFAYSYVFNEIVKQYLNENGAISNYENFYQYIIDISESQEILELFFDKAKAELIIDKPYLDEHNENYDMYYDIYLLPFTSKQYHKLSQIINYLIADILSIYVPDNILLEVYSDFVKYINKFDQIEIFTLNHDIILERLLNINGLEYSRGFTKENSPIVANDKALEFYTGSFDRRIKIYKLHGSLDLYRFNHHVFNGYSWRPNGSYDYYLTTQYYDKHSTQRLNPNTGEIVQDMNFDIVPKFITGTDKSKIIANDRMYKEMFEIYEKVISETDNLFVSGYSFNDEHINDSLKKNTTLTFLNHRKSKNYPFAGKGRNITYFEELP